MKRLLCFLILVFPVMGFAQSGYINTIAGTTTAGFGGDGGRASAAVFSGVLDVIYDAVGNIYVADNGNRRIRKIDPSGIITTVVGGGTSAADSIPATNARINISTGAGLCEDNTGNLYFCDSNRVRKVDVATGIVTTVAGTGYQGFRGDGGPATAAWLSNPNGVCFDRRGNMYIGDRSNGCVRKVDTRGIISTFAGGIGIGYRGDGGPATAALLNSPATMCFDAAGNLYVADIYNFRIRKIDVAGTITTFAGTGRSGCSGDGGPATVAEIGAVQYLSIDNYDNLYFSDPYNGRIRMIDCFGRVRTVAGGGSLTASGSLATAASISAKGVEIDACGNIYVGNGNIVSKVDPVIDSPTALADTFSAWVTPYCGGLSFTVIAWYYTPTLRVKTWFGDGTSQTDSFASFMRATYFRHQYHYSGAYTIKQILYDGTTPMDSITYSYTYKSCQFLSVGFYYDANNNCVKDSGELMGATPFKVAIDSNGVAIDTLAATGGLYYNAYGDVGDIYTFTIFEKPSDLYFVCPSTGIILDTINTGFYPSPPKNVGFQCSSTPGFDIGVISTGVRTGTHTHEGYIYASNAYCPPVNSTVTLNFSPRHGYSIAIPTPTATTATSITWNIPALSSTDAAPTELYYRLESTVGHMTPGDTVHSNIIITPETGDSDTTNNVIVIIDTVKAGFDPNAIYVQPGVCIRSGDTANQLQYTITFENTGNDTAHNIYVLDTLPDFVDATSMRIVMASHEMYTSKYKDAAGHTILKFDFPHINLLDSSHHGQCDGALIYTINTRPGLALGAQIINRAGIYFDVNEVVMTNEANTAIGCPTTEVTTFAAPQDVSIYPNPTGDILNIDIPQGAYDNCTITNSIGAVVMSRVLAQNHNVLQVKELPAGVYYVTLRGTGGVSVRKLVKG